MKTGNFLILFFVFLLAASPVDAGGGSAWGTIIESYTNNNWTMVRASGITDNPDSCTSVYYYAVMPEDKNYETIHSTLLAAQIAEKSVRFYLSGCSGQYGDYPHIVSIWIKD